VNSKGGESLKMKGLRKKGGRRGKTCGNDVGCQERSDMTALAVAKGDRSEVRRKHKAETGAEGEKEAREELAERAKKKKKKRTKDEEKERLWGGEGGILEGGCSCVARKEKGNGIPAVGKS